MPIPTKTRSARTWALAALLLALSPGVGAPVAAQGWPADPWLSDPVEDETFRTYLDFFQYDRALPFATRVLDVETVDGIRREHLTFESTPGEWVFARYSSPGASAGDRPALLVLHGGTGGGKDTPHYRALAMRLVRAGFNVLAIDMLHFGERDTGLMTTFTEADKHDKLYNQPATYLAWVTQTMKDAGRSYDFLVRERGADPGRVGLVGYSRGAQVGYIVGGADDRFAAVALLLGGHFDRAENAHRAAACPANYAGRIQPRPLFLINGIYDSDYDREKSVLPLHRLTGEPKEVIWAETGHSVLPEHLDLLADWLRKNLR